MTTKNPSELNLALDKLKRLGYTVKPLTDHDLPLDHTYGEPVFAITITGQPVPNQQDSLGYWMDYEVIRYAAYSRLQVTQTSFVEVV